MSVVYRLKATRGHGWVEYIDARGPTVTGIKAEAKTWDDLDAARRDLARVTLPSKIPFGITADEA